MQVAPEHSKAVRQGSRVRMKERFFLNWIALNPAHVSPWNVELPPLIESHLADTCLSFWNRTAMPAGKTADTVPLDGLVEFAWAHALIEYFTEGRQRKPLPLL